MTDDALRNAAIARQEPSMLTAMDHLKFENHQANLGGTNCAQNYNVYSSLLSTQEKAIDKAKAAISILLVDPLHNIGAKQSGGVACFLENAETRCTFN